MHRKASIELVLNLVPTSLDKKLKRSRGHLMFFKTIHPTPFSKAAEKWKCFGAACNKVAICAQNGLELSFLGLRLYFLQNISNPFMLKFEVMFSPRSLLFSSPRHYYGAREVGGCRGNGAARTHIHITTTQQP